MIAKILCFFGQHADFPRVVRRGGRAYLKWTCLSCGRPTRKSMQYIGKAA